MLNRTNIYIYIYIYIFKWIAENPAATYITEVGCTTSSGLDKKELVEDLKMFIIENYPNAKFL